MAKLKLYKAVGIAEEAEISGLIAGAGLEHACYLALYTDHVECDAYMNTLTTESLLSVRVFCEGAEFMATRDTLTKPFTYRLIDDAHLTSQGADLSYYNAYDEEQYLDIDAARSQANHYVTSGGGQYILPLADAEKILLRNYVVYNDDGEAEVRDFRIVKFKRKGE